MSTDARNRLKLAVIGLLFFAPLIAAAVVWFLKPEWIPSGRLNYGTLISPSRPLAALVLFDATGTQQPAALKDGRWSLVYLGGARCDEACEQRLVLIRQVRLALNQNRSRVQRVYVAPDAAALEAARAQLHEAHPDLQFFRDAGAPGARATDFFQGGDPQALYLVDPLGNWLMFYTGEVEPKGLHKDIKKLLRFSQVG